MVEVAEITKEFLEKGVPKSGRIIFEEHFDRKNHADEIQTAEWLWRKFGGDIVLLCESKKQREKMPDYLWRGTYWERKGISSSKTNTIHIRIKKAYSQIDGKRGGIILDFTNGRLNWREIEKAVMYSLIRCAIGKTDIIMIKKNTFKVWQAIKK